MLLFVMFLLIIVHILLEYVTICCFLFLQLSRLTKQSVTVLSVYVKERNEIIEPGEGRKTIGIS